jgi:hypothetical protein
VGNGEGEEAAARGQKKGHRDQGMNGMECRMHGQRGRSGWLVQWNLSKIKNEAEDEVSKIKKIIKK